MNFDINRFQKNHLSKLLTESASLDCPLDAFLAHYFRSNKSIGSKDRRIISEIVYGIIRWQGLIDHFLKKPICWESRIDTFLSLQPEKFLHDESIPAHVRLSFPKSFYDLLVCSLGELQAKEFCFSSNFPAPTMLRVNVLKANRADLLQKWSDSYKAYPSKDSPHGIYFPKRHNFFTFEEFKQGFFEIQDEGSQLIADLVDAKPGSQILDYCSGSGGKTLAFAHKLEGKGQIYLHDVRVKALCEAKKRLARAGIQNVQLLQADDHRKKTLIEKMDCVLVDAPCSGTGTLRRNPDMKWKFQEQGLHRLIGLQRTIFEEALKFVKPNGTIVYATCSVLPQENDEQATHFINHFPLKIVQTPFRSSPTRGGMDGFFGVIFQKTL